MSFTEELVNAYMDAPAVSRLVDHGSQRCVRVEQMGMHALVVWNPGKTAAAQNPEIRDTWNRFVCVESANCLDYPVRLSAGNSHRSVVKLGFAQYGEDMALAHQR